MTKNGLLRIRGLELRIELRNIASHSKHIVIRAIWPRHMSRNKSEFLIETWTRSTAWRHLEKLQAKSRPKRKVSKRDRRGRALTRVARETFPQRHQGAAAVRSCRRKWRPSEATRSPDPCAWHRRELRPDAEQEVSILEIINRRQQPYLFRREIFIRL